MNAANPVSPKVVAGLVAGAVVPVVLSVLASVLNWLVSGSGESWLDGLLVGTPPWVPVVVFALVSALSAAVAGYVKTDPLRIPVVPADSSHLDLSLSLADAPESGLTEPDLSWTPGDESERNVNGL